MTVRYLSPNLTGQYSSIRKKTLASSSIKAIPSKAKQVLEHPALVVTGCIDGYRAATAARPARDPNDLSENTESPGAINSCWVWMCSDRSHERCPCQRCGTRWMQRLAPLCYSRGEIAPSLEGMSQMPMMNYGNRSPRRPLPQQQEITQEHQDSIIMLLSGSRNYGLLQRKERVIFDRTKSRWLGMVFLGQSKELRFPARASRGARSSCRMLRRYTDSRRSYLSSATEKSFYCVGGSVWMPRFTRRGELIRGTILCHQLPPGSNPGKCVPSPAWRQEMELLRMHGRAWHEIFLGNAARISWFFPTDITGIASVSPSTQSMRTVLRQQPQGRCRGSPSPMQTLQKRHRSSEAAFPRHLPLSRS